MIRPPELASDQPLIWSSGRGTDVWDTFVAAMTGDVTTLERLLDKDPSLIRAHWEYRRAMYFAVRENQVEAARLLLSRGADPVNAWGDDTLPEIARDRGYTQMLALLESARVAENASPLGEEIAAAIRNHDLPKVRTILDATPDALHAADLFGNRPIHWAAMTRQLDFIDELAARGADLNIARRDGARPLQLANGDYHFRGFRDVPKDWPTTPRQVIDHLRAKGAYCDISTASAIGDIDRVRELLAEDPFLANRSVEYLGYYLFSGAPLHNAAARGHMDIVLLLLEHGADPNLPEEGIAPRGRALYDAVYNGHHEIAKLLLERGANPSQPVESSADALAIALMNKDDRMVELLCSYGSTSTMEILAYYGEIRTAAAVFAVNPPLADDPVALGSAAAEGQESFVRLMLRYRPETARRVHSPWASPGGKTRAITELLFAHGMDPNFPNWLRVTPLHEFAKRGDVTKAALYLDRGADIHARDEHLQSTPLAWAAKYNKILMVELLLRRGAKLKLPDDPAWATPQAWADRRGHAEIAALLREFEQTGSLPPRDLALYEAHVADLIAVFRSGDAAALDRLRQRFPVPPGISIDQLRGFIRSRLNGKPEGDELVVEDARYLVARGTGFDSWEDLAQFFAQ